MAAHDDLTHDPPFPWGAGFRSLSEEHSYRVELIEGAIPVTLRGTHFRNGSGRNELTGQWFPHWFDALETRGVDDFGVVGSST